MSRQFRLLITIAVSSDIPPEINLYAYSTVFFLKLSVNAFEIFPKLHCLFVTEIFLNYPIYIIENLSEIPCI